MNVEITWELCLSMWKASEKRIPCFLLDAEDNSNTA